MKNKTLFLIFILFVIGFFIYAFNLHNPLFWDDDDWIKNNTFVHSFSYLKEIFTKDILAGFGLNSNYYRPLLLLSFALNYVIHGIKPFGYHLLSNAFHIANGIFIFLILLMVFKKHFPAFIAALLFLIHPLQTEAVTYISGRGDPMSVFFMLLSLWLFIKYEIKKKKSYFVGSLLSMIAAILSRETAFLFPVLLMIFYTPFYSVSGGFTRKVFVSFKKSFPFWVISVVYIILRLTAFNFKNTLNFYSQANDYTQHLSYRLYTFGHVLLEYFKLIFAPVGLHMERDLPLKTSLFQWPVWLSVLLVLGIIFLIFRFYKKEKGFKDRSRDIFVFSRFRVWFFSWSWFFVSLAPVSGIIPINAIMYEHWLYLPLIGFFALAGFYIYRLFELVKNKKNLKIILSVLIVGYFSFFSIQSIKRNIIWGKPIEFYENILKYNPYTVRILNNLGNLYSDKGDLKKAEEYYLRAIASPNKDVFAQPYYNLGNLYRDRGEFDKAIALYKKAIQVDPNFPFAYQNLAVVYINNKHDLINGIKVLEQLKKVQPGNPRVYYNLAILYLAVKNVPEAKKNIELGLQYSQKDPQSRRFLEDLMLKVNQLK